MSVQVQSIGEPLGRTFEPGCEASVLARYDSTLQLESDDGALWAITTRPNPAAMRVVAPTLPDWREEALVRVREGRIFGEGCELAWEARARFDPVPRQRTLSTAQRASAARTIAGALARHQLPDALGFWDELDQMWEPLARVIASPEGTKQSLKLEQRDCFTAQDAPRNDPIRALLGRGPGLTPTGDDFLQALLVTLASGDAEDRAAFESLERAVAPHLSRTTRLSRAFLREALNGWAFGALKDMLDELPRVSASRVDALLRVGASSGTAYALGVLMGLSWNF